MSSQGYKREVSLGGDFALKLHKGFSDTLFKAASSFHDDWTLKSVYALENDQFENDYEDVKKEFTRRGYSRDETTSHYGFLATIHDKMLDIVVDEGLRIKSCPINTLGHSISGIHLNKHADVCLDQASTSVDVGSNMILVTFKFMYGKSKSVSPFEIRKELHAPTPSYDSHIPIDKPEKSSSLHLQHINSLVYLYEFENSFLHPLPRPRHVCPIAALVFRSHKRQDINYSQLLNTAMTARPPNPIWTPPNFPMTNPPFNPYMGMVPPPFPNGGSWGGMPTYPGMMPPFTPNSGALLAGPPTPSSVSAYMQYNMMQAQNTSPSNSSTERSSQPNNRDRKRPNSYRDNISLTDTKSRKS